MGSLSPQIAPPDVSRIIEMAWEDRTPFEAIEALYGLSEAAVITVMRSELKPRAFRNWRQRVSVEALNTPSDATQRC